MLDSTPRLKIAILSDIHANWQGLEAVLADCPPVDETICLGDVVGYGGDPKRIVLMGESAGASHVAAYALEKRFQPLAGPGLAGAILLSGFYDPAFETVSLGQMAAMATQ